MGRYVKSFGGQLGLDLFGHNPDFANADFVFPQENVVAELKCLTDDKSQDQDLQQKLADMFESAIARGFIPDPGPGRVILDTEGTPIGFQREVYALKGCAKGDNVTDERGYEARAVTGRPLRSARNLFLRRIPP